MATEITARGKILLSKYGLQYLHIDNPTWLSGELSRFEPDTSVVVSIKKYYKKRSLKQNNLFWAYCNILGEHLGYDKDDMKTIIQLKFLKEAIQDLQGNEMGYPDTGEVLFTLRSTASLNTLEMASLCEQIRIWGMQSFQCVLPLPDENISLNFK